MVLWQGARDVMGAMGRACGIVKAVTTVIGVTCAVIACPSVGSAQQWDPWGWDRHPRIQTEPLDRDDYTDRDPYDNREDYDDRSDPGDEDRSVRRGEDWRRYDPRDDRDPYFDDRNDERRDQDPRYFDERSDGWRNDYGAWDATLPPDEEERLSKTPGVDGGARPYIAPAAPPRVAFSGPYAPGSVVIDTSARKLYYVLSSTSAYAYPIGVGRQGFTWTGKEKVSRITDWPDWYPPAEMRKRKPDLPVRMLGGIRNPLGVKAIYLGNTLYRIHGTNDPKSIGKAESSGCFRMLNEHVLHLASLVSVGTEVAVVRALNGNIAAAARSSKSQVSQERPRSRWEDRDDLDPYGGWH
jgi:lipoprotein-anchoring transpeptidase ErfK/SrfK